MTTNKTLLAFFFLLVLCSPLRARTAIHQCSLKPLNPKEKELLREAIRKTPEFLQIKDYRARTIKIKVSRCQKTVGHIEASYILFKNLNQKKCSINSMNFPLTIENGKVTFKKIRYGDTIISPALFTRKKIKNSLVRVITHPLTSSFFKDSTFCQIEHRGFQSKNALVFQLRNKKKQYCYFRSSLDGKKVEVIKKLYAKTSRC